MAKGTCSVVENGVECGRVGRLARGMCDKHYMRWLRRGDPGIALRRGGPPVSPESFWSRTVPNGACLDWVGRRDKKGYGRVTWDGVPTFAHRVAFFLRMDRWPDGDLRHLCDRPICVLHAVEGSRSENVRDSVAAGTHGQTRKTHCPAGHEYTPENTYRPPGDPGHRICRTCRQRVDRDRKGMRANMTA